MQRSELSKAARALHHRLVEWRRHLHRRPELAFEETETAEYLEQQLQAMGIEVETGIARTGVVGRIRASRPRGPAVLLRADMDALPVQEVEGRAYGSEVPGKMHACGHDGHMSMLLGAAQLLGQRVDGLARDVVLCFQPAEECEGGARAMIEAGVLDRGKVGSAYALHLWSLFPAGTIQLRSGPMMAAQDEFVARFVGRGGHGAQPHRAVDPIVCAAQSVSALQGVVARSVDPLDAAVVTVGTFEAGSAPNIIPETARLGGTLRAFREDVRELLRRRVRETLEGAAASGGCRLELELHPGYPAVVNHAGPVAHVQRLAREIAGADKVVEPAPMAASEDFAYFLEAVPGAFIFVGAGNVERGITAPHHSPEFDIDESALTLGAELLARIALEAEAPL